MADAGTPRRRRRPARDTHHDALAGQRMLARERNAIKDARAMSGGHTDLIGGDPGRVSRAQVDLWLDDVEAARGHPEGGTATAFASII